MRTWTLFLLALASLALTACNRENVENIERNPEGGIDVTITIGEAEVMTWIDQIIAVAGDPLLRNPSVDLTNGQILVTGERDSRSGDGRVTGTIALALGVQDGILQIQTTSASFQGEDVNQQAINDFNAALQARFEQRAQQARAINYQSVSITEDDITIVVNARRVNP